MPNLSLTGREIKKLRKPYFRWNERAELGSEIRRDNTYDNAYDNVCDSDNDYDVTNFLFYEKFLAYALFIPSFIVVRHQMVEFNWGGGGGEGVQKAPRSL